MWYAAHVIMYFKVKKRRQGNFLVHENVFLVEAASTDEAFQQAERLGRADEMDYDGGVRVNNRAAALVFAGVRKVVKLGYGADVNGCGSTVLGVVGEAREGGTQQGGQGQQSEAHAPSPARRRREPAMYVIPRLHSLPGRRPWPRCAVAVEWWESP
jgi:hypothetical protein